jgi:predicted nucleic acid-binding protein
MPEEFACMFTKSGQPIDLIGGVKLTGRAGRLSFGLLDVQTEAFGDLKSKNLAVGWVSLIGSTLTRGDHCITLNYVARRKCNEIRGAFHISNSPWIPFHFIQATLADQTLVHSLCVELDREEAEAIACASELNAELLFVDEERGRAIAQRLGLRVIGLLGVLIEAKHCSLIDAVNPILDTLVNRAGFWVTRDLYVRVLQAAGKNPSATN